MAKLSGFKKVAIIRQGYKDYYYALYDDCIVVGDKIIVSGTAKDQVWKIKDIISCTEHQNVTAEVICKVDTSEYDQRVAKRKQLCALEKQMDQEIKMILEDQKYELYAKQSPKIAELLAEYKLIKD